MDDRHVSEYLPGGADAPFGTHAFAARFASAFVRSTPNNMLYLVNALSQGFVAAPAVGKSVVARSTSANMLYGEPRPVQIIPSVPPLSKNKVAHPQPDSAPAGDGARLRTPHPASLGLAAASAALAGHTALACHPRRSSPPTGLTWAPSASGSRTRVSTGSSLT